MLDAANGIGLTDLRQQFGAARDNFFLVIQILKNDCEFVTADARGKTVTIKSVAETLSNLTQQHVPRLMSAGVVDDLESIEIQKQKRGTFSGRGAIVDGYPHPV